MLDKQYSRVIRWVNRAQTMSAGGNYSDAILDVECARAELDDARQELLLCHSVGTERKKIPCPALAVAAAFCAVFFLASPLQISAVPAEESRQAAVSAPQYASAEQSVARAVEESIPSPEAAGAPVLAEIPKGTETENSVGAVSGKVVMNGQRSGSEYQLSERDVYRLVEVGRSALKKNSGTLVLEFN